MMNENQNTKLCQMLHNKGFTNGWVLAGETLVLWEHDVDPPAPLTRPDEAPAPSPDSAE
jgi:hypothetical protein